MASTVLLRIVAEPKLAMPVLAPLVVDEDAANKATSQPSSIRSSPSL